MSRLSEILEDKKINNNYYKSVISSIKYPQKCIDLNYTDTVNFPNIMLNENDFLLAIKNKNLSKVYSLSLEHNIFSKGNFLSALSPQNLFLDFEDEVLYSDEKILNSTNNMYESKRYSIYDLFEEENELTKDNITLYFDEEQIILYVDDEETIVIKKNDTSTTELFENFIIYLYILYISEDSLGFATEKELYVKTEEQIAIENKYNI